MDYLAHIRESGEPQSVKEHLDGVAALAQGFAAAFGAEQDAAQAALLHDIGKYSLRFQEHIRHPERQIRVDHSTAGAQAVGVPTPVSFAIAGHHGGLPDGGLSIDTPEQSTLLGRLKRRVEDCSAWQEVQEKPVGGSPGFARTRDRFTLAFYTRMLYSCLVDADYLDTEHFMQGQIERGSSLTIEGLRQTLHTYLEAWKPPATELNQKRKQVMEACAKAARQEKGLYTLTVPTGGGKTLASLRFALDHAARHGMRRVIYVIPYTSIIDQTVQVFQDMLGEEAVLAHHSGVAYEGSGGAEAGEYRKLLATENWDAPVIVTTAVQFFESLFANRSSQCRKLHNIANAVVIFDEAQTLPLPYLRPCVAAVAQLVRHYGVTAVLCTATQPALEELFAEQGLTAQEICPERQALYEFFRRVTYKNLGLLSDAALVEALNDQPQALCIVNRRAQAQNLYEQLTGEGNYCLSTLEYPAHRAELLKEIRSRLKQGLPCRVVSTSLIEAGVDVDFPTVFREEAGLDSIIQAGGRCNRENKRPREQSLVYIFRAEGPRLQLIQTNITTTQSILAQYPQIDAPEAVEAYFKQYRNLKGEAIQDKAGILEGIAHGFGNGAFPFAQVAEKFKLIETPTQTVYIPRGEGAKLADRLQAEGPSRALFRALGRYSVSVYPQHFKALEQAGCLQVLDSGDGLLCDLRVYSNATGLALEPEGGREFMI